MGADGKSAYYRIHHKWFKAAVFEFGEQVLAKPMRSTNWNKVIATKRKLSLRSNWIEGTWVGFCSRTNEHLVAYQDGGPVVRVRTVRARPSAERWNAKAIEEVKATPEKPNPKNDKQSIIEAERNTEGLDFGAKPGKNIVMPDEKLVRDIRDFRITDANLEEFGFT